MKKRYRFGRKKFVRKVIVPLQFITGLLLLIGAGGTEGVWQAIMLAAVGVAVMWLTTLYK